MPDRQHRESRRFGTVRDLCAVNTSHAAHLALRSILMGSHMEIEPCVNIMRTQPSDRPDLTFTYEIMFISAQSPRAIWIVRATLPTP